jgi:hypothetical protein
MDVGMTWITTSVPQELFRQVKEEMEGSHRATAVVGAQRSVYSGRGSENWNWKHGSKPTQC